MTGWQNVWLRQRCASVQKYSLHQSLPIKWIWGVSVGFCGVFVQNALHNSLISLRRLPMPSPASSKSQEMRRVGQTTVLDYMGRICSTDQDVWLDIASFLVWRMDGNVSQPHWPWATALFLWMQLCDWNNSAPGHDNRENTCEHSDMTWGYMGREASVHKELIQAQLVWCASVCSLALHAPLARDLVNFFRWVSSHICRAFQLFLRMASLMISKKMLTMLWLKALHLTTSKYDSWQMYRNVALDTVTVHVV